MAGAIPTVFEQLRRNAVAFISLFIAVSGLAYNTWRNERTEEQRNVRAAAFKVIENLGELQEIVDARYYYLPFDRDMSAEPELRLRGFGRMAMSRDLMGLMPPPAPATGKALHDIWLKHFNALSELDAEGHHTKEARRAEEAIRITLDLSRAVVLEVLRKLD